ncbi:MAG TPA: ABC transporter ATP-binding protein [Fimbriimonadaceae bacterium]|nr:ABC transporter ATP-binding protein [Fimbriimonadaceae bacterium]
MLRVERIGKSYGTLRALDDVSIEFAPGEIHAVLGENGAGKSTLMHILAGFTTPDSGSLEMDGRPLPVGRPFECKRLGIAMIHQHFTLVPAFSVEENLALSRLSRLGPLDMSRLTEPAREEAGRLGWGLDFDVPARRLPVGAQQRIEIVKTIAGDSRVAIFDEPTAVLSPGEVDDLFRVLQRLKEAGKTVILIAHKLREVMAVADRVTVLRRGKVVAGALVGEVTPTKLAEWMVGELPPELQKGSKTPLREGLRATALRALGDRGKEALRSLDFEVSRGEILGVGGVDGNGQVELAEVLAGVRPFRGELRWEGNLLDHRRTRVAYIPQDRQSDGLALSMTIEENLLIEGHRRPALTAGPFLRRRAIHAWSEELVQRFGVKGVPTDLAGSLSGGNQQKVVVARALDETPDLLIAVNPSRGLDVKATEYVHRKMLEAQDQGAAVVLISTDLEELAALGTRTVFLSRGEIVEGGRAVSLAGGID